MTITTKAPRPDSSEAPAGCEREAASHRLTVHCDDHRRECLIELEGGLDWFTAGQFLDVVTAHQAAPKVVLDVRGMTEFDGAGTSAILSAHLRLSHTGSRLVLVTDNPDLVDVLDQIGALQVLTVVSTKEAATAS